MIAEVLDPYEGDVISQIIAPTEAYYFHKKPLITQRDIVCKTIRRLHEYTSRRADVREGRLT